MTSGLLSALAVLDGAAERLLGLLGPAVRVEGHDGSFAGSPPLRTEHDGLVQRDEVAAVLAMGLLDRGLLAPAWASVELARAAAPSSASSASTFCTPARLRPSLVSSWMRRSWSMSSSL